MKRATETQLVRSCLDLLALRGVWAWRSNSGSVVMPATTTTARRFVRFNGAPGMSDIVGVWPQDGRFVAIECKVGRNKPTPQQQAFLDDVNENGGMAVCVWSTEDLDSWLRDHGVRG